MVLKKNLLNRNTNFSNLKTKEDFVLWLRLAKKGTNMLGIDKYLTSWRKANNSLSSSVIQKICDGFRVYFKELKYNKIKSLFLLLHLSINSILK